MALEPVPKTAPETNTEKVQNGFRNGETMVHEPLLEVSAATATSVHGVEIRCLKLAP